MHENLFLMKYEQFMEAQNTLDDWTRVSFHKAWKQ